MSKLFTFISAKNVDLDMLSKGFEISVVSRGQSCHAKQSVSHGQHLVLCNEPPVDSLWTPATIKCADHNFAEHGVTAFSSQGIPSLGIFGVDNAQSKDRSPCMM